MEIQYKIKNILPIVILLLVILTVIFFTLALWDKKSPIITVTSFEECVEAGNPIMESYPRGCQHKGQLFVEEIFSTMTEEEALGVASGSAECLGVGGIDFSGFYNPNSKTWWFDLNQSEESRQDGCSPACVVWEESRQVEVNWRCAGLIPDNS